MADEVVETTETESDVQVDSSPTGDTSSAPAAESVASPVSDAGDRPLLNLKSEFDRKLTKVERQLEEIAGFIQTQQTRYQPAQQAPQQKEYTDAELMTLFQQGSVEAGQALVNRQVARSSQASQAQQVRSASVAAQLNALYGKYPVLRDNSHPLTEQALQAKRVLMMQGSPNNNETDLAAILVAVADNPDIVSSLHRQPAQAAESARVSSTNSHTAIDGNVPRRQAPQKPKTREISEKEKKIAARMGIKDPGKALERFAKRGELGPLLGLTVTTDNLMENR